MDTLQKEIVKEKKPKCFNCKHGSTQFKIAGKTHLQCRHPKHEAGFKDGTLCAWDTLQEFYNTCESHEFTTPTPAMQNEILKKK